MAVSSSSSSATYRNVIFNPTTLSTKLRNYPVEKFFAVGLEPCMGSEKGTQITNHWFLVMQVPGDEAVILDMFPSGDAGVADEEGELGILMVQHREYVMSKNTAKYTELELVGRLTAKDFFDVLIENGYQNFDFNEEGAGCRYYVMKVLRLLEERTMIKSKNRAFEDIAKVWNLKGEALPGGAPIKGTFH